MSHELIGGAAAFEVSGNIVLILVPLLTSVVQAARAYEKHVAANGQPTSHAEAKEIL